MIGRTIKVLNSFEHGPEFIYFIFYALTSIITQQTMHTPIKIRSLEEPETQYTRSPLPSNRKQPFDYKQKIFDLINENTELKIHLQALRSDKFSLDQTIFQLQTQINNFLKSINFVNLQQAAEAFKQKNLQISQQPAKFNAHDFGQKEKQKLQVAQSIMKLNKDNFRESIDNKIRELQLRWVSDYENMKRELSTKQRQITDLKVENCNLKQQNLAFQKRNQSLKQDLNMSIHKYEELENLIDEKMKFYIQKLHEYEETISNLSKNKEIGINHTHKQFSFCRDKDSDDEDLRNVNQILGSKSNPTNSFKQQEANNVEKNQNLKQEEEQLMNAQCYRASIEGLLQQNKRLKASFQNLYKTKQGEQIADELLKQINIMKSIIQLNEAI